MVFTCTPSFANLPRARQLLDLAALPGDSPDQYADEALLLLQFID